MSLYILDTDHLTLHRYGHPVVTAKVYRVEDLEEDRPSESATRRTKLPTPELG